MLTIYDLWQQGSDRGGQSPEGMRNDNLNLFSPGSGFSPPGLELIIVSKETKHNQKEIFALRMDGYQ